MIHMKRHTSYDDPTNKRFWKPKSAGATGAISRVTGVTAAYTVCISKKESGSLRAVHRTFPIAPAL